MNEKAKVLVTLNSNWADEINFHSVAVVTRDEANSLDNPSVEWPMEIYYGTNEDGYIKRSALSVSEIPEGLDPEALEKLLDGANVGNIVYRVFEKIYERLAEQREDAFEEEFRKAIQKLLKLDGFAEDLAEAMEQKQAAENMRQEVIKLGRECPNKTSWRDCECDACQERTDTWNDMREAANEKWLQLMADWSLTRVPGYDEFGTSAWTTFRLVVQYLEVSSW